MESCNRKNSNISATFLKKHIRIPHAAIPLSFLPKSYEQAQDLLQQNKPENLKNVSLSSISKTS
jgi:hypothetical protein